MRSPHTAEVDAVEFLAALAVPVLWNEIQRVQYVVLRMTSFLDPGAAPQQVSYQLRQSLIAVGSGGAVGVGFGEGRQHRHVALRFGEAEMAVHLRRALEQFLECVPAQRQRRRHPDRAPQ